MGIVYLAEHPVIGRKVALKAIHPELSRNPEVVSRFMTEAKSVNQIGNEHIVDVHDFGNTSSGEFYFIMEFLQGEALADRLRRERLFKPERALQIAAQVADALAASHSHGIIHRDLKPENIFLIPRGNTIDFVKVLDFGLAKLTQGEEKVTHKTRTGSVMGTPYYMAPEQCEGRATLDHRADVYSLGVILYEMLTGRVPFGGDGYGEIIVKHITMPPPSPRASNPELSLAHEAILFRALAKNRDDRFANMEEMRTAMLDPERYLATAPSLPQGGAPGSSGVTMQVGAPAGSDVVIGNVGATNLGPRSSMPSTFRDGAGELLGDDVSIPKRSRRGLAVTLVVAAAVAAGGAYVVVSRPPRQAQVAATGTGAGTGTPAVAPPSAVATAPVVPAAPAQTVIKLDSRPPGATVARKDTNAVVGTTPLDYPIPVGAAPVEFVFRKAGFQDTSLSAVPQAGGATLTATLVGDSAPPADEPARPSTRRSSRAASSSHGARQHTPRPVNDEDGVLEPSFK
jgi:tRNA A-37 threonylcarbamoyl transferase component Bud32